MGDAHDQWVSTALGADPASYATSQPGALKIKDGPAADEDAAQDKSTKAAVTAALKKRDWQNAAELMGGMGESAMFALVKGLPKPTVRKLHAAAIKDPALGKNAPVAMATAAIDEELVGAAQSNRAAALAKKLPPKDQEALHALMDGNKPKEELDYLEKGLAAGHSVAELQAFDKKIAGKDAKWLQDNLSLTGNSKGKGVKQQWSMSCNATVVEAVRGQLDPLYALKMHEDNPNLTEADDTDATKMNKGMAADQKAMLQSANPDGSLGGQARNRNDQTPNLRGRWNTDLLNKSTASTGLTYQREFMGTGKDFDKSVSAINDCAAKHMPVPLIVGDGAKQATAHYVLVTGTDPGPPRYYSIHDPATGDTVIRSEDQLRKGNLDLNGWNKIAGFEKPTPVPVK